LYIAMATYRINGLELYQNLGIILDEDKTTADSFEALPDIEDVFTKDWGDGVIEYDLKAPVVAKPRVLNIKGTMISDSIGEYQSRRTALKTLLNKPFVTVEQVETGYSYKARRKPGSTQWHRITNLDGKVAVAIQFQLDEVKQDTSAVVFPAYTIYYGPSSSVPVTEADILALTPGAFANEIILNTGTNNRIFSLVTDKTITSITDLDAGSFSNLTVAYTLRGTITISGITYKIYSLENALPYTSNHRHKFIIA
jgi:hypothetical protein